LAWLATAAVALSLTGEPFLLTFMFIWFATFAPNYLESQLTVEPDGVSIRYRLFGRQVWKRWAPMVSIGSVTQSMIHSSRLLLPIHLRTTHTSAERSLLPALINAVVHQESLNPIPWGQLTEVAAPTNEPALPDFVPPELHTARLELRHTTPGRARATFAFFVVASPLVVALLAYIGTPWIAMAIVALVALSGLSDAASEILSFDSIALDPDRIVITRSIGPWVHQRREFGLDSVEGVRATDSHLLFVLSSREVVSVDCRRPPSEVADFAVHLDRLAKAADSSADSEPPEDLVRLMQRRPVREPKA
jgi:hypothetical protein